MAKFSTNNTNQPTQQSPLILPASTRHSPDLDIDEERIPIKQQLGQISDSVFGFLFDPNVIKFGLLLFAGFCVAINLSGYYDLINQVFNTRLDELGRTLPVDAPLGERFMSSVLRFPIIGTLIGWLDKLTGGLVALFGAITIWFFIQGLEIAGRFHLYFPEAADNFLYKQNRRKYEAPANNNPATRIAYKMASTQTVALLRWLGLAGVLAYLADTYAMDITRPWLDTLGNPLWINVIWNSLAVLGVEAAMLLHRGYKAITLSHAEKADKNKHFN